MVIEWTSPVPVWSDTLRPEPSNLSQMIEAAFRANSMNTTSNRKSATPRRSASRSVDHYLNDDIGTSTSRPSGSLKPPSPRREEPVRKPASSSVPPLPRRRPLPVPKPKSTINPTIPPDANFPATTFKSEAAPPTESSDQDEVPQSTVNAPVRAWSAEELAEVEPLAINYLQTSVVVIYLPIVVA
jgi:hypothetical protein